MLIRKIVPEKFTFSEAVKIATVSIETFKNDTFIHVFKGARYVMPIPPPASRMRDYKKLLFAYALIYYQRLCDPKNQAWVMEDNGEVVGLVAWTLPIPLYPRQSLYNRIKAWAVSTASTLLIRFLFLFDPVSLAAFPPSMAAAFEKFETRAGMREGQTVADLATMAPEKLQKMVYPRNLCTWCWRLFISPSYQGQKLGFKLFDHSMRLVPRFYPMCLDDGKLVAGPAKLALFASPDGLHVYKKAGFSVACDEPMEVDGASFVSSLCVYTEAPVDSKLLEL